jgi:predicted nucleic acid-binding protein
VSRRVLDTGVWIAWFADEPLAEVFAPMISDLADVLVPAIVEFEVHRWALRHSDEERAAAYAALLRRAMPVPVDGPLALEAAVLAHRHRLAACDALIYATAQLAGARVVTTDADLEGLPGVDFYAKPGRSETTTKAARAARRKAGAPE